MARLIRLPVIAPKFPLFDVSRAELPILFRLIDPRKKSLALFLFRQVEEEFDDPGSVPIEMILKVHDGTISLLPNGLPD